MLITNETEPNLDRSPDKTSRHLKSVKRQVKEQNFQELENKGKTEEMKSE